MNLFKHFSYKLIIVFFCFSFFSFSQKPLSSEDALKKYKSITAKMENSFPENEFKTYNRESFSEQQLQTYLIQHYQRLDLLPFIDGHHFFKMQSYLHSGNWFMEIGFPEESIKWYTAFFNYYNTNQDSLTYNENQELVEMITYSYSMQANNYAKIKQLDSAAIEHKKNITFIKNLNTIANPSAFNNYGLFFYWDEKDLDSALIYFNKAYTITKNRFPNHTLIGSIRDNIADVYSDKNKLEIALPLYQENFELYKNVKNEKSQDFDVKRLISAGSQVLKTEVKLNRLNQAEQTLRDLTNIFANPTYNKHISGKSELEFLNAQETLFVAQNKIKEAYAITKLRLKIVDSLNTVSKITDTKWQDELNTISLDRVALNFKIDKIEKENKISSQRLKLWIVTLTSSSILILLLFLFLNRRQRLVIAKNKQLFAEKQWEFTADKNAQLQSEIKSKKRDLSDFAINLTHNQKWAKNISGKLKNLKAAGLKEQKSILDEVEQSIENKITVDSTNKQFYERLDKLSDAFYKELTAKFPNLSKNEIRICSLIRLKMDSRSIATLQNISLASVNTSRYRLRKKLNLTEDIDLDDFILNM